MSDHRRMRSSESVERIDQERKKSSEAGGRADHGRKKSPETGGRADRGKKDPELNERAGERKKRNFVSARNTGNGSKADSESVERIERSKKKSNGFFEKTSGRKKQIREGYSEGEPENSDGRIRLNKFIASSGLYSRREADRLIEEGEVTVDDLPAEPGMMVTGREKVRVGERVIRPVDRRIVVAYYKPAGVTVTKSDPHASVTLEDVFHYPVHLTYAGRLDRDSEGLLLMTNDGQLIDAMMRSANQHEKEYIVRTRGKISDEDLHAMSKGIWLKDLDVKTRPCRIERLGDYTFRIVLTQGLNRQIRRMCRARGHEVKTLKRVRVLNISVKGLHPGMQREVTGEEKKELYRLAGIRYDD